MCCLNVRKTKDYFTLFISRDKKWIGSFKLYRFDYNRKFCHVKSLSIYD